MKPQVVPVICGAALAVMTSAAISHWWSVKNFVAAFNSGLPITAPAVPPVIPSEPTEAESAPLAQAPASRNLPENDPAREKFYEALVSKMESLQNQNRDLLDQMAETNRDVMKLEFRVDTHSESFRPMKVSEDRPDTSFDDGPGVLPPRAEPVFLPTDE